MSPRANFGSEAFVGCALLGAAIIVSCSQPAADSGDGGDSGNGGSATNGGAAGTGVPNGGTVAVGGTPSGGTTSVGGAATGGVSGTAAGGAAGTTALGGSAGTPATGGTAPGGAGPTGGVAGAATGGAAGAGAGAGAGGSSACAANPPAQTCGGMAVPADGVLIDFATYTSTGAWGVSTAGDLTGGTSVYGTPTPTTSASAAGIHITAMVPAMGYTGIVFWFGPCVNASTYTGLSTNITGSLGGAVLKMQVQTHVDYPVDVANTKGGCVFTNCDTKWSECVGPTATVPVPSSPAALPWTTFTGGKPTMAVTPDGLVGIQFQFECQAESTCAIDTTIGTITLTM